MEKLIFDSQKVKVVKIEEVRPNAWNPKEEGTKEYENIKRGLELKGQRLPIIVRENEGYEIIDGEQRWRACQELGFEKIIIYNEGKVSDKEAQELTLWYQQQVPFIETELASMLKNLAKSYENLEVPYRQQQIDDYIKLLDFDWEQYRGENLNFEQKPEGEVKQFEVNQDLVSEITDYLDKKEKEQEKKDPQSLQKIAIVGVKKIKVTEGQMKIIWEAVEKVMKQEGISLPGRAFELICADYLAK